jgi:hypothetical protein
MMVLFVFELISFTHPSFYSFRLATNRPMSQIQQDEVDALSVESVMSSIYYYRVHNYVEQIALINVLNHRIESEMPRVKLIIVDRLMLLLCNA